MGKWTKVKDQLPPDGEFVFVYGYFDIDVRLPALASYHDQIRIGCWEDEGDGETWFYIPSLHCDVPQRVTHWRPLFKPPKE